MKHCIIILSILTALLFVQSKPAGDGLEVGDKAIDFELKSVNGNMVSLSDYENAKGYIVIFTCNHCPYAQAYEDRIIALHKEYARQGYPVIAINPNDTDRQPQDSFANMKKRAEEKGFQYPYVLDETQKIAKYYGATRTPHVYLLDKSLTVKYIGAIDNNYKDADAADEKYVEEAIEALQKGKKVDPDFTKAVGCTIKWKEA